MPNPWSYTLRGRGPSSILNTDSPTTERDRGLSKYLITKGLSPLSWPRTDLEPTYAPACNYLLNPLPPLSSFLNRSPGSHPSLSPKRRHAKACMRMRGLKDLHTSCAAIWPHDPGLGLAIILGGPGSVVSRVVSASTVIMTIDGLVMTPFITAHGPPSRGVGSNMPDNIPETPKPPRKLGK